MTSRNFMVKLSPHPKLTTPPLKKAVIIACRNESDMTSASCVSCERDTAQCWWCTHGTQPQTPRASGLRSHDGTDPRTDARSCHRLCSVYYVYIKMSTSLRAEYGNNNKMGDGVCG